MSNLRRFFIQTLLEVEKTYEITGEEFKHLAEVMRAYEGMQIVLLCGDGFDYVAEIVVIEKKKLTAKIINKTENNNKYKLKINFYCGSLKGDGNYEQATQLSEIGINSFTVFSSAFSVAKGANMEKLLRISRESYKQCRRAFPMDIFQPCDFNSALKSSKGDIKLIAYEEEVSLSLISALENYAYSKASMPLHQYLKDLSELSVDIIIGSEGGLKQEEITLAKTYGFESVSLGKNILKAPTAALVAAAMLLGQSGEF